MPAAKAQKTLTYPEILTALGSKLPNRSFRTKQDLIAFLITQIQQRRVDKPLTESREEDLRQAGATDELIAAIRANSPSLPTPQPMTTPAATPLQTPASTATPSRTPPIILRPLSELLKNAPKPGEVRKNSIGMELVYIPPGEFMMGSSSSEPNTGVDHGKPQHQVRLSSGFWLGKYEVTQGQWRAVMGNNPSRFKDCDACPVESVSWHDIKVFLGKINQKNDGFQYRLPTEAEWEYAARAGTKTLYGGSGDLDEMGWYRTNSEGRTHPVGQKQANSFGLYDMHGNVKDWCEDRYGAYTSDSATDPTGAGSGITRVLRGGSWSDIDLYARSASRSASSPSFNLDYFGFRVAARPK